MRIIENAIIRSTQIGIEDHGILTFWLNLDFGGNAQGFGGYAMDGYDRELKIRVGHAAFAMVIRRILEVVGVQNWEDLPGKPVRADRDHGNVYRLGHYLEDKWVDPEEIFNE